MLVPGVRRELLHRWLRLDPPSRRLAAARETESKKVSVQNPNTRRDFAMLDINLGIESSLGFAASLRERRTPFLFASGYGQHGEPADIALQGSHQSPRPV
jgi:hypothetical protein